MYYDTAGWTYSDVIGLIFSAVFVALTVLWLVISTLCACCECCGWVLAPWLCGGLCACRCCPCQCCRSDTETDNPDLRRHWLKITHVDRGRRPVKDDLNVKNKEPKQRSPLPVPRQKRNNVVTESTQTEAPKMKNKSCQVNVTIVSEKKTASNVKTRIRNLSGFSTRETVPYRPVSAVYENLAELRYEDERHPVVPQPSVTEDTPRDPVGSSSDSLSSVTASEGRSAGSPPRTSSPVYTNMPVQFPDTTVKVDHEVTQPLPGASADPVGHLGAVPKEKRSSLPAGLDYEVSFLSITCYLCYLVLFSVKSESCC